MYYIKDCGKIKYLKQLERFVFDEKKAFKIRPIQQNNTVPGKYPGGRKKEIAHSKLYSVI